MKKWFVIFIAICLVFSSCNSKQMEENKSKSQQESIVKDMEVSVTEENVVKEESSDQKEEVSSKNEEIRKVANNGLLGDNLVRMTGKLDIYQEFTFEDKVNIYENIPLELTEGFVKVRHDELVKNGWKQDSFQYMGEGSFYMKGLLGDLRIMTEEEYLELSQKFLDDGGFLAWFQEQEMTYELTVNTEGKGGIAFCYITCEGQRTGSFIRMIFEDDNVCGECKAYLYKSRLIEQTELLPLEEALTNVFYMADGRDKNMDEENYLVINVELEYIDGLPYYYLDVRHLEMATAIRAYALAIDISQTEQQAIITEKYLRFGE